RGAVVEVLLCARRPEEGYGLRNVVDQFTRRQAELRGQPFAEPPGDAQRKGMVQRVALRLAERAHTGVLRKRLQKLAITDQRLVEQRLRMIGKHVIERIGDPVGAQQLAAKSEIRRRQLIVSHTALPVIQVLPLAAE